MGSGKTSWAIDYINHSNENILYITPFLSEVDRIIESTDKNLIQPTNRGKGKLSSLNDLLFHQKNIVSTHALFRNLDEESIYPILTNDYVLILDECLNVVEPYSVKKNDIEILLKSDCIHIDDDSYVVWNCEKDDYESKYDDIMLLASNHSLVYLNNSILLWVYPPMIFRIFNKIFILTYLFEGSILKPYFDLNRIDYEKKSVMYDGRYKLENYQKPDCSVFRDLINLYDGKLNDSFPQKDTSLSVSWYKAKHNKGNIIRIKNNLYNYFTNILKAKSNTILWTTYKAQEVKLKGRGYSSRFLSCNCRATNDYALTFNLAYCLNMFVNPAVSQYFYNNDIIFDNKLFALSEMLQWIWRSRIRNGKQINLYIPSFRMRNLLVTWLTNNQF